MSGPDTHGGLGGAGGSSRVTGPGRPADHGGAEAGPPEDDRAPLFGRWGVWYALVVLDLLLVILICAWITRRHP